jgi:hypothetical protein
MSAQRVLFLLVSIMILAGIALTGFGTVHWFLYVPAAALAFGGITGICPGLMLLKKLGFS